MSIATRLTRLAPSLTARERVVLVIRAHNAGQDPDPDVLNVPQQQRAEYDRYIALCIAANNELGLVLHFLMIVAADMESRAGDVENLRAAASALAEENGLELPRRLTRNWRYKQDLNAVEFLVGLSDDIKAVLLERVELRWQELQAVEYVAREIAAKFDGEDPRASELLEDARQAEQALRQLAQRLGRSRSLPAATQEIVEEIRLRVDNAFSYLGLRETRS